MTLLILLGGGLRATALFSDRCLWIDEAMLALNLVGRSPIQLLEPLDYNQGAPLGFLMGAKLGLLGFGESEWVLRLLPFAASLAGLLGFAWLAHRFLAPGAALLALALFSLSPHLITYASECKQYASDAAITVGLLAASVGLLEGKRGHHWVVLALAGAVAVWCSHPAAFVLGGIGGALLLHAALTRDQGRLAASTLTVGCWLASFGICYAVCLKHLGSNKYLTGYWTDHFLPASADAIAWIADHVVAFFEVPGGFGGPAVPVGGVAALLALIGLREFARERWPLAVALAAPVGPLLLASAMQKYPFGGRLLLFFVPVAVLLVARGTWAVYEAIRERNRFAAVSLLLLLVGAEAWQTLDSLRRPPRYEQLAPTLEELRAAIRPDDRVYVYSGAVPAFNFYTRSRPLPCASVTLGSEYRGKPGAVRQELMPVRGRLWVVFSHPRGEEVSLLRATLESRGTCEREMKQPGAAVWLYRLE